MATLEGRKLEKNAFTILKLNYFQHVTLSRQAINQEENKDIFRHKRFQTLIPPGTFSKTLGATDGSGVYQKRCWMVVMKRQGGQPARWEQHDSGDTHSLSVFQPCSEQCVPLRSNPRKRNTCEPGSREIHLRRPSIFLGWKHRQFQKLLCIRT